MKQITAFFSSIDRDTWIIIVIIVLIIIIVVIRNRRNKTSTTTTTTTFNPNQNTSGNIFTSGSGTFPLKNGSRGSNVVIWQNYLNTKGAGLNPDGVWGPLTEAASLKYTGINNVSKDYFDKLFNMSTNTNTNTNTTTTNNGLYSLGASIYSKGFTNGYKTSNVINGVIKDTFQKDELIGTFVAYDNSSSLKMIKVYSDEYYLEDLGKGILYVRADEVYSR